VVDGEALLINLSNGNAQHDRLWWRDLGTARRGRDGVGAASQLAQAVRRRPDVPAQSPAW
jgi:hypothetical protein